jgi:hypothetical protein
MPFGIYMPGGAVFGISIIFVGAALCNNGLAGFWKDKDGVPLILTGAGAWPNTITGIVLILNNFLGMLHWGFRFEPEYGFDYGNFYFPMLGLYFGCVYLLSGIGYKIKSWDDRPYGLFCIINAVVLLPMALWEPDWRLQFMWICWVIILLAYGYEGLTGKKIGGDRWWWTKRFCFFCGIFTGIVPGLWMLSGTWGWMPWW